MGFCFYSKVIIRNTRGEVKYDSRGSRGRVEGQGDGWRMQGTGCRVQGAGYRGQGAGYRVQGAGVGA